MYEQRQSKLIKGYNLTCRDRVKAVGEPRRKINAARQGPGHDQRAPQCHPNPPRPSPDVLQDLNAQEGVLEAPDSGVSHAVSVGSQTDVVDPPAINDQSAETVLLYTLAMLERHLNILSDHHG